MPNFWGPKIDKTVINSSTKCLISVKIAILTPHIIPPPLVNIWLIFDLQKYVKWRCMFLEVNPCFQKAHLFCMDLQPAADPYNVVCSLVSRPPALFTSMRRPMQGPSCSKSQLKSKCLIAKFGSFLDHSEIGDKGQNVISSFVQHPISLIFAIYMFLLSYLYQWCGFCCQSLCRNLWPQFVYIAVSLDWKINIHVWSCVIYWGHGLGGFVTFSHISSCLSYHIFSKMNTIIASLVSFEWEINALCKDMKRNYRIDFAFKLC